MRYHDYMNEFTVLDETKTVLFGRMSRRMRQLRAARGELERIPSTEAAEKTVSPSLITAMAPKLAPSKPAGEPKVKEKKKNTFKLHPKRWVAIFTAAALVITATPLVYFFGFRSASSVKLAYMKNLMVDTDGVTAYSIKKGTESNAAPAGLFMDEGKNATVSLLSGTLIEEEKGAQPLAAKNKSRNYLYSTNESYELGNVEYDENGITKVTFMKNKEVTEDVYDDDGNLIDAERKITQEELDAQINKIYTTKVFTYIQFVAPVGSSGTYTYTSGGKVGSEKVELRPESMTYDENGVAEFDKYDYATTRLTASFVIENDTGYIYKIEDLHILRFENGLLWAKSGGVESYYSIGTDEEHNLVFTDVMPNKDVTVLGVLLDPYGWTYVLNNRVDEKIVEKKIIYTTKRGEYLFDSEKNAYFNQLSFERDAYYAAGDDSLTYLNLPGFSLMAMVDGDSWRSDGANDITSGVVTGLRYLTGEACMVTGQYKGRPVYHSPLLIRGISNLPENGHALASGLYIGADIVWRQVRHEDGSGSQYPDGRITRGHWLDENYDLFIGVSEGNHLYFTRVDLETCLTTGKTLDPNHDFASLSDLQLYEAEDYYLSVGSDRYKIDNVYYYAGTNETNYYRVVKTDRGFVELEELTSKSYTDSVFIFQPINK